MTANSYNSAASNNPVFAGQINQFLVDHNVGIFAYSGSAFAYTRNAPTATYGTNTGGVTGQPQMIGQAVTTGGTPFTMGRLELLLSAATVTGGASGADVTVSIQTDNSGVPSGTILCSAYIPASWLTATAQVISIPMTTALSASTKYWVVVSSSTGTTNYVKVSSGGAGVVAKVSVNGGTSWSAGATELYFNICDSSVGDGFLRGIQADSGSCQQTFTYSICTINAAMNTNTLPQGTFTVDGGTQGFAASGSFSCLPTSGGQQAIAYTGKTARTFTGCSGGAGTLATDGLCYTLMQPSNVYAFTAYQSTVLGNLIVPPDDSFEVGIGSWAGGTNTPTVATSTVSALYGLQSMLVTMTSGSASTVQTGSYFAATAGSAYALQAFVLSGTAHLRNVNVAIAWYDTSGVQVGATVAGSPVATSQTVWANPSLLATAPANTVNARVILQFGSIATTNLGDTYYVDGVGLTQTSAVPPWSPGGLGQGSSRALTYTGGTLVSMA